jgi:hypothetical protein
MKATIITTSDGHELIYGPVASGKTYTAKQRITNDYADDRHPWIIDLDRMSLPEENESDECRIASTVKETRTLLHNACGVHVGTFGIRRRYPAGSRSRIMITIEEASEVFADPKCRRLTERLLRCARKENIRLRVIVRNLTLESFGGSELIRSALLSDDPIERAMGVYRGMTGVEREQVFRSMAGAVAGFAETRNAAALATFADNMAMAGAIEWRFRLSDYGSH